MLKMGVTRVELGVQNIYDHIYRLVERGHTVKDVIDATRILKDSGLKLCYHCMPGLPGSNFKRDINAFQTLFKDPDFKPDMIKIYPCLVLEGTKAYEWWREGKYTPYTTEEAANLIAEVEKFIPPWVRIMRIQRDIPAKLIAAGVNRSNLRQLVDERLKAQGVRCRCIRCREVGHRFMKDKIKPDLNEIKIMTYAQEASKGVDLFISAEDPINDVLLGYLRLRIPSEGAHRPEILPNKTSIVRELHVYGPLVPLGKHLAESIQHKGYGAILLAEAEKISREEYEANKILVTSAIGTRQYYSAKNYKQDGPYVAKKLV
ncbi:MAG TPA: tRNA uridine(34) 5-carboxymethylaminomethyl modification radical SAM/GNAT enzyme Elp3 [archaeon]|nr:tRNA uridine(34) 5-carboxymethylaminomethyl modification radical SAM/GNAT enzyme Elp3 [archaeon]